MGHFAKLIPYLAENYRVYAIDLLGFGASDKLENVEYGPELWADLVCGVSSFPQSSCYV
jgi:pimeloyl-ACP methyl ester carboxylesterase